MLTGVRIFSETDLSIATPRQLVIRAAINMLVVLPLGIFLATFFVFTIVGIFGVGFVVIRKGNSDSWFLNLLRYDTHNGQTIADRRAGTLLVHPRDLESLALMATKIEKLHADLHGEEDKSIPSATTTA